jgi:hypothetical protein
VERKTHIALDIAAAGHIARVCHGGQRHQRLQRINYGDAVNAQHRHVAIAGQTQRAGAIRRDGAARHGANLDGGTKKSTSSFRKRNELSKHKQQTTVTISVTEAHQERRQRLHCRSDASQLTLHHDHQRE